MSKGTLPHCPRCGSKGEPREVDADTLCGSDWHEIGMFRRFGYASSDNSVVGKIVGVGKKFVERETCLLRLEGGDIIEVDPAKFSASCTSSDPLDVV